TGHGEGSRVERHLLEQDIPKLRRRSGRRSAAALLGTRAHLVRKQRGRDPHVADERSGVLLTKARLVGLPTETPERAHLIRPIPNRVRSASDPVTIAIVRICERTDGRLWHGLEQTEPDEKRRRPRRQLHVGMKPPVPELVDRVGGTTER